MLCQLNVPSAKRSRCICAPLTVNERTLKSPRSKYNKSARSRTRSKDKKVPFLNPPASEISNPSSFIPIKLADIFSSRTSRFKRAAAFSTVHPRVQSQPEPQRSIKSAPKNKISALTAAKAARLSHFFIFFFLPNTVFAPAVFLLIQVQFFN